MLEALPAGPTEIALVYRARRAEDLVFRHELDTLARTRQATVHYVLGSRRESPGLQDPIGPEAIRRVVPDVAERDVYLCGPASFMDAVRRSLDGLGVPPRNIHAELFAY
jgi:ferredoxin-NADP reductase